MFLPTILLSSTLILNQITTTMATNSDTKQLSPLPKPTRFITGHNSDAKSIVHTEDAATWTNLGDEMGFFVPYTTSQFPVDMNNERDIAQNKEVTSSGKLGLVNPGGTVCRYVDFAPGNKPVMHQTVSLDYGIVLEGEVEMILDSGEKKLLKRGDVAIQRGTMHAWKNPSETEWARLLFVLQASENVVIDGKALEEDIPSEANIQPSR